MKLLVTGGAGFIGSNFIRWILARQPEWSVVNLDKLTYAGNPANCAEFESNPRYDFQQGDICDASVVERSMKESDAIVHFAAESHVDRSIESAHPFLQTNVMGTATLLEAARKLQVKRFLFISTDEVYGPVLEGSAEETAPMHPSSPYAVSKAAGDLLVKAYHVTHGFPALTVRASNNYGPYQFPEKFLPLMITQAMEGCPLPIYGDGLYEREWLFVEDFCSAIQLVLEQGRLGESYNVGTESRLSNLSLAQRILKGLNQPESLIEHVMDRPGHDRRYAINSDKLQSLGWKPTHSFDDGLEKTLNWYQNHADWWGPLKTSNAEFRGHTT